MHLESIFNEVHWKLFERTISFLHQYFSTNDLSGHLNMYALLGEETAESYEKFKTVLN
jgi:hypothetical protein